MFTVMSSPAISSLTSKAKLFWATVKIGSALHEKSDPFFPHDLDHTTADPVMDHFLLATTLLEKAVEKRQFEEKVTTTKSIVACVESIVEDSHLKQFLQGILSPYH